MFEMDGEIDVGDEDAGRGGRLGLLGRLRLNAEEGIQFGVRFREVVRPRFQRAFPFVSRWSLEQRTH